MTSLPKISIVIPSFNKGKFISKTLESIFSQKYPNLEVIVKDGGSKDGTVDILKSYSKKFKSLMWVSESDKGQLDAINKGMDQASGDILTYINADDYYEDDSLIKVGKCFQNNSKISWVAGKGRVIDGEDNEISRAITTYKNLLLGINKYPLLLMVNYLMQPSVFLSRSTYKKHGPFTGTKKYVMEYDLWLKIGKDKMPEVLGEYLSNFRLTVGTISTTSYKLVLASDLEIVENYTNNKLLLFLHKLNNLGRNVIVNLKK
jgi:glycosyltransferase involved in cell wall biosynthesis